MARFIMIVVLGGMFTFGINNITQNSVVSQGTQNTVDNFSSNRARDIAGSMADILMMRLSNDLAYRVNTKAKEDLYGGEVAYTVAEVFFENDSLIEITVIAKFKDVKNIVIRYTEKPGERKELM